MKIHLLFSFIALAPVLPLIAEQPAPKPPVNPDTVILNATGAANLGLQTAEAVESKFEQTAFALGRIEEIPDHHAVVSSRISGRVVDIRVQEGDAVEAGQTLVRVESRQPGNPPPIVDLPAPISGLAVTSHVRLGEPVEPEKELLDISDLREVWAIARVPEHLAGKLAPGSKARITIAALGNQVIEGTMLRFGTEADAVSGTIDAVFKVPNPDLRMRAGMRAEFSLVLSSRENVLSIPRMALQGDATNRHVFIKDFEIPNAYVKTPVQTGEMNDRFVEIISGLFPGDEVVTRGAYSLSFAGPGTGMSRKEFMDAAHGHEHADDGSELTPEIKAEQEMKKKGAHSHDGEGTAAGRIWMYVSGVLAILLVLSLCLRSGRAHDGGEPGANKSDNTNKAG